MGLVKTGIHLEPHGVLYPNTNCKYLIYYKGYLIKVASSDGIKTSGMKMDIYNVHVITGFVPHKQVYLKQREEEVRKIPTPARAPETAGPADQTLPVPLLEKAI